MVSQAIEADLAGHGLLQQLLVDGRVQPNDLFQVGVKTILFCRSSLRLSRAYLGKSLNCRFSPWGREVRSRERKKEKKREKKLDCCVVVSQVGDDWQDCRGYGLVLTGHSLGAGTAALLSMLLRPHYGERLHCWAFSPPGGLLSRETVALTRQYVTSVVIGHDIIPRLRCVRNKATVFPVNSLCKRIIYQDRLGTDLRQAPRNECFHPAQCPNDGAAS